MSKNSGILKSLSQSIKGENAESFVKNVNSHKNTGKTTPSIIAKDVQIEGDIISGGIVEIEGKIKGQIAGNSVIIREDGVVFGDIKANTAHIRGIFNGNVKAENVNIFKKGKINGNIEYKCLSVEDGASIEGQFKKIDSK